MRAYLRLLLVLTFVGACNSNDDVAPGDKDANETSASAESTRVLDLNDVKSNPNAYEWFDFRPNIKKLILAGDAASEHIAVLWYTTEDGGVALHYHAKTESVYVIDGSQRDAKGVYPTGTVYFNPPKSGHQVTDSSGFFLLAYAAPPDFNSTDAIEEYEPIRIDTAAGDLTGRDDFKEQAKNVHILAPDLAAMGGMTASLIELSADARYVYTGNYILVLDGACKIAGVTRERAKLVVTNNVAPQPFSLAADGNIKCLALAVSFSK
jgi:hypothetical protein